MNWNRLAACFWVIGAAGCQSSGLCGKGAPANFGGRQYCYYDRAITEEGFRCPASLPNQLPLGELEVCAAEAMLPPGLAAYLRQAAPDSGAPVGVDASVVDAEVASCLAEPPCQEPSGFGGDEICVAGRVFDGASHLGIDATTAAQIEVRFYEPLNFLADPTSPPRRILTVANRGLDSCGRYMGRVSNALDLPNGMVMVATRGRQGTAGEADFVVTYTQARTAANINLPRQAAYIITKSLSATWSAQAGLTGDLAADGALVVRYHTAQVGGPEYFSGEPVAGVSPLWNFMTLPLPPLFFSDDSVTSMTTLAPALTRTGRNGTALLRFGRGLGNASAVSGAPNTCLTKSAVPGQLTITGMTLTGATADAIGFFDLEAACD
ncbi:MAG: hypothetical protein IT370_10055 [Deltaproteobacteria bacterium]|nr:hypothetical protein [Deltaproteobacteria bacterium]